MEGSCLSLPGTAGDPRAFCGEQTSACDTGSSEGCVCVVGVEEQGREW